MKPSSGWRACNLWRCAPARARWAPTVVCGCACPWPTNITRRQQRKWLITLSLLSGWRDSSRVAGHCFDVLWKLRRRWLFSITYAFSAPRPVPESRPAHQITQFLTPAKGRVSRWVGWYQGSTFQLPIRTELADDVSAAPAVAKFGDKHLSTCLGAAALEKFEARKDATTMDR
jgi:hypothetical protein